MQRFKSQTRPKPFYTFRHIAVSRISSIALLLRLDRRAHDLVAPVPLQHHRQHQDDRHHVHLPLDDIWIHEVSVVSNKVQRSVRVQKDPPHSEREREEVARPRHGPVRAAEAHQQVEVEKHAARLLAHEHCRREAERAIAPNDEPEHDVKHMVQHVQLRKKAMEAPQHEIDNLKREEEISRQLGLHVWLVDVAARLPPHVDHGDVGERGDDQALELGHELLRDVHRRVLALDARARQTRRHEHVRQRRRQVPKNSPQDTQHPDGLEEQRDAFLLSRRNDAQHWMMTAEALALDPSFWSPCRIPPCVNFSSRLHRSTYRRGRHQN
mmetsp:Transcript_27/g.58  ORF Transcript_27/g.58 Transcript_27/m.58 type:complete len:324 (-) Transcript_27:30-1001(-)